MEQGMQHTLMLEGRNKARVSGVTAVVCFNDQEVVLQTAEGEVALLGEGLHIEQLNLEAGELNVTGGIDGIEYSLPTAKRQRRGLFRKKG